MLGWLKRNVTPVPGAEPVGTDSEKAAAEVRLGRLLGRLESDGRTAREAATVNPPTGKPPPPSPGQTAQETPAQSFDWEHYRKSVPFYIEVLAKGGGQREDNVHTIAAKIVASLREEYGVTPDRMAEMRPYLVQFVKDVRDGAVQLSDEAIGAAAPAQRPPDPLSPPVLVLQDIVPPPPAADSLPGEPAAAPGETAATAEPPLPPAAEKPPDEPVAASEGTAADAEPVPADAEAAAVPATAPILEPDDDEEAAEEPAAPALFAAPPVARGVGVGEAVGGFPQKMFVIAVASQKGGVGKTTISAHLAVQAGAMGQGPAVLIDTDPQGSLGEWWRARKADTPALAHVKLEDLVTSLAELRSYGTAVAIVDTPPALTASIEQVIAVADLVVIPARPSPHDLRAVGATVDMVRRAGKPFCFVVNGAAPRASITAQAVAALSEHGRVAPVILYQRVDFAASMIDGRTVMETAANSRSAQEIADLWRFVYEQIGVRAAA